MKTAEDEFKTANKEDASLDDYINPGAKILVDFERIFGKNWTKENFIDHTEVEDKTDHVTPLHLAALFGHLEIFKAIFDKVH